MRKADRGFLVFWRVSLRKLILGLEQLLKETRVPVLMRHLLLIQLCETFVPHTGSHRRQVEDISSSGVRGSTDIISGYGKWY